MTTYGVKIAPIGAPVIVIHVKNIPDMVPTMLPIEIPTGVMVALIVATIVVTVNSIMSRDSAIVVEMHA